MPNYTVVPPRGDHPVHGHFWVPINDHACWAWSFDYHPTRALTHAERSAMEGGASVHVKVDADYKPLQRKENNYGMDREAQRQRIFYSGIEGIGIQDASLQESLPAFKQAIDCDACICVGVHKITASTSGSAKLSAKSVVTWAMPYLSATSLVLLNSRPISDTTSTTSMFLMPSKCLIPKAPAPAKATLIVLDI
jgi:hypothetical protein